MATTEERPSRRERRRTEIRERIVETAFLLFETQGYDATTVTEIAERADIAYGTLFQHFPSKLDLLREVSGRALDRLFEDVEEVSKVPASFEARLILLFDRTAENAESMGPETRDLISAMLALSIPETADSDDRRIRLAFRNFLSDGLTSAEVRDDEDLETLVEVVVGAWYSVFLSWVRNDAYPLRDRADAVSRFLARMIASPIPEETVRRTIE